MTYDHIKPNFNFGGVVQQNDPDRLDFFKRSCWVGYKHADHILDTLHELMRQPAQQGGSNLLIVGDQNNGKTAIVRRFQNLYGSAYVNEQAESVKPVIITEAPPSANERGLYISILERFWAPYDGNASTNKLREQAIYMVQLVRCRLLFIDEFHSLFTGTPIQQFEVINAIELLRNALAIPIVGVGNKDVLKVLHTNSEHSSRFEVIHLPLWECDKEFQTLLTGFEKALPLKNPSSLHTPQLASALHAISEGNLGNLHKLLIKCSIEAIRSGAEEITNSTIQRIVEMKVNA